MKITNFFVVAALLLSSCLSKSILTKPGDPDWGVQVTYQGHSCFTLKDSAGRLVVIDPFDDTVGYGQLSLRADVVLISHQHFDHNFKAGVRARGPQLDIVDSTGTHNTAAQLSVLGIASFHDAAEGQIHGANIIFTFTLGGLRFAHLGDLGQDRLTSAQLSQLGAIDVLFVPVGGVTTLNAARAKVIEEQIKPLVVIPMHYGNSRFYPLDSVEKFEALTPTQRLNNQPQSGIRLRRADLEPPSRVWTLSPSSRND